MIKLQEIRKVAAVIADGPAKELESGRALLWSLLSDIAEELILTQNHFMVEREEAFARILSILANYRP